jgi:hypothetical protein
VQPIVNIGTRYVPCTYLVPTYVYRNTRYIFLPERSELSSRSFAKNAMLPCRMAGAAYLASFLARADYVPLSVVSETLRR